MSTTLPLADHHDVRRWLLSVVGGNRREFAAMMALFGLATIVGLAGPQLLGRLVDAVSEGTAHYSVDVIALAFVGVVGLQAVLQGAAGIRAGVFGERLLADAREGIVGRSVRLPLSVVESAGTGDLLSRATSDVDKLDEGLRQAAPEILIASITVALTAVAMFVTSPVVALGVLTAIPLVWAFNRWYRPRIVPQYQHALANWAKLHSLTHETAEGGRTVEALRLRHKRVADNDTALDAAIGREWECTKLFSVFLAGLNIAYLLPIAAILLIGGAAYAGGVAGLGQITAVVLYARAMADPLEEVLSWLDELQVGAAALRRILGVQRVPPDIGGTAASAGRRIQVRGVRFAYQTGRDVLTGIDLDIAEGERVVVVGPSGAGKSTLGRLLAGINAPDEGEVLIGGAEVSQLPLEQRRKEVVLVTQEQHVFTATLRENLTLPRQAGDAELWDALRRVNADGWAARLADGLDTKLGSGGEAVAPAVSQQLALARLLLADPHTLILDEATSLLDSSAARDLEESLSSVLNGRTVIAIAHQLTAARNADRIAVMDGGRIIELGSHDELMADNGSYASLVAAAESA
jgi:ABC-type multidrug transport system fused ATPase/permease subunit